MGKSGRGNTRRRRLQQPGSKTKNVETKEQSQNGKESVGCCATILVSLAAVVSLAIAVLAYAYATSPISSVVIRGSHNNAASMKWNQNFNTNLQKGRKILTELTGGESIVVDSQGNWYTGLDDGRLLKIIDPDGPEQKVIDLTNEVDYTAGGDRSLKRPLGMRIFEEKLYLADAYQGIFAIDLKTLTWEKLAGFNDVSPHMQFTNDLTITQNGDIYFTDACGRWPYKNALYSVIEGRCTGRTFKIGSGTNKPQLVRDQLCFANGIELSRDETKLLISENSRSRISIVDLVSGATEKMIPLHGGGDNIRRSPSGGYWVPIPSLSDPSAKYLERYPFIRDIVVTILGNSAMKLARIHQGTILKLNEEFEIEQIHQDLEGKVAWAITQVQEYQPGKFLLGSFIAPGIVKLGDLPSHPK